LPSVRSKHLETVSHTLLATVHALWEGYDAVLLCNAANAPFVRVLQLGHIPVALNVDGLERKRRKWGIAGRSYYRLCERLATLLPDVMITDAEVIRRYYRRCYRAPSEMIVYGGDLEPPTGTDVLQRMELEHDQYLLYVSRFEPENNPDRVVDAYTRVSGDRTLVMVGGAPYAPELTKRVTELADTRVLLPGPIYGDGYRQLLFGCRAYIHATEVGGTHPALVEAMGAGRPVLYYDTPENREVVGDAGRSYRFQGDHCLEDVLEQVLEHDATLAELAEESRSRVVERYRWSDVADEYERVLSELC
jgi:glycosyltransferase involved in cell wall biosynthesis